MQIATTVSLGLECQIRMVSNSHSVGRMDLMDRLAGASDFEAAASELMEGLGERISQALRTQFGGDARFLRAVIHIRPNAEYSRELFGNEGFVRAEWAHRSDQLSSTFALRYATFPFISPSYDVVNLRAGLGNERWSVNVYAENLFDEEYYSGAYEKAFYSGVQVEPSVRSFGVDFRYRLGAGK